MVEQEDASLTRTELMLRALSSRISAPMRPEFSDQSTHTGSDSSCIQGTDTCPGTGPNFWPSTPSWPRHSAGFSNLLLWLWRRFPAPIRRFSYKILVLLGAKFYPPTSALTPTAQRLLFNLYCKFRYVTKDEVLATMFVGANTTIPVPKILDVVESHEKGSLFVLMTMLPGVQSWKVYPKLDTQSRTIIQEDLRNWLDQLRNLPVPPNARIGSFTGGSSLQYRIATNSPIGPFSTTAELHDFILSHVWDDRRDQIIETAKRVSYNKHHRIVFTHGDLHPRNILIHNGRLSGLVDFGSSGWFPEYWDHATATFATPSWWKHMFFKIFPQYQDEIDVEDLVFSVTSTDPHMH